MRTAVAGNGVNHEMLADTGHGVHFQLTGRPRVRVAGFGFGFFHVGQDLLATQQIALPASVSAMRRVVRLSKRVCRWASRLETARETLAVVVSSCTAAAVKLPASATQLKARMFCKVSMECSQGR